MTHFPYPIPAAGYPLLICPLVQEYQQWISLDQIPVDETDAYRRSAARLYALNHQEELTARILPLGSRVGDMYRSGGITVALDYVFHPQSGLSLHPGMWTDERGCFGGDLIELYAYVHGVGYEKASSSVFGAYRGGHEDGQSQIKKPPRWRQDIHPMHDQSAEWPVPGIPHPSDVCIFKNGAGQAIAVLHRIKTISGGFSYIYYTLWRRNGSYRPHWAAIFPSEAFFLHADIMGQALNSPVHVLLDPFVAMSSGGATAISTALPAGPSSIPDADLSLLHGRDIRIDLDPAGVEEIRKVDRALKTAGVTSAAYSLPSQRKRFLNIDEATNQAEKDGFVIKGRKEDDGRSMPDAVVIAEPGRPIPGSEVQRDMLLHPFLKEAYLVWLYAPEKIGKSWLASGIAQTVATGLGMIGKWTSSKRAGVLLVDGEMLADELDETIRLVSAGLDPAHSTPKFEVLCAKSQPSGLIDIEDEAWQHQIEKRLVGKKLLILDNLQSLMANGGARLDPVQAWFRRITQKGIAIFVLDHSNAEGELQGSIAKRRIANVVISMHYENDEAKANGIATVTYESARRLHGPDAAPFLLRRTHEEGAVRFEVLEKEAYEAAETEAPERIRKMALVAFARHNNIPFREIVDADGQPIPPSTGSDLLKASASLGGEERLQFEAEIARLEAEEHPDPEG